MKNLNYKQWCGDLGNSVSTYTEKKVFLYTHHQALKPLSKRNRCNKKNSARLIRWLDRLAHFDISIQHIAGNKLKNTDFLSRNPVEGATTENLHDAQYVINILTKQAESILKFGRIFKNPPQCAPNNKSTHERKLNIQSEASRTIENNRDVNKTKEQTETVPNSNSIKFKRQENSKLQNQQKLPLPLTETEMDRDYYQWGVPA